MPKTFALHEEHGMRGRSQVQQTGHFHLPASDIDEDDYDDDDRHAQTAFELRLSRDQINQSEFLARHTDVNRPVDGIAPGTSSHTGSAQKFESERASNCHPIKKSFNNSLNDFF